MLSALTRRGEQLARRMTDQEVLRLAQQLQSLFNDAAVQIEEARVLVRGRGILRRWLSDPNLRFLGGGPK
jgi:hypothetical protein